MKQESYSSEAEMPSADADGVITVLHRIDPETGRVTQETIVIGGEK
jgi:hypothetical protein